METGLPLKEALIHHSFLCWTRPPTPSPTPFHLSHPGADGKLPLFIQLGKYEMQKISARAPVQGEHEVNPHPIHYLRQRNKSDHKMSGAANGQECL